MQQLYNVQHVGNQVDGLVQGEQGEEVQHQHQHLRHAQGSEQMRVGGGGEKLQMFLIQPNLNQLMFDSPNHISTHNPT